MQTKRILKGVPPIRAVRRTHLRVRNRRGGRRRPLITTLPRQSIGAEIGVWKGDFTEALLHVLEPSRLHIIDPWVATDDEAYAGALYGQGTNQNELDDIYNSVLRRFSREITSGQLVVHPTTSTEACSQIPDNSLDWVYIDGDHSYDAVLSDLRNFRQKVRPGGIICGDDYVVAKWWGDSVIRAVNEFAEECDLEIQEMPPNQFVIRI